MSKHQENAQPSPLLRLGAGATAGIVAMSAAYPMDMVRGRITVQAEKSPRGMFHALDTVYCEEGFQCFIQREASVIDWSCPLCWT
ncbi:mitochondrial adenine nucleotide transporter ADNT1-like [Aegilops tauschii subsp. strangulata]|uniref:mitochondrial adenine nucleotide transporter ADNT1-like n=1 Tax=Aegilops tauschii subsp. strangulata TaxID=200361 RepID=UPI003CC85FB2